MKIHIHSNLRENQNLFYMLRIQDNLLFTFPTSQEYIIKATNLLQKKKSTVDITKFQSLGP